MREYLLARKTINGKWRIEITQEFMVETKEAVQKIIKEKGLKESVNFGQSVVLAE